MLLSPLHNAALALVRLENDCCFFLAPQQLPGSSIRPGPPKHLRLLRCAVSPSAHQEQRQHLFLPGSRTSTQGLLPLSARTLKSISLPSSRQACSDSLLSSEVGLPSSLGRKSEAYEGDAETRRLDRCLILKRKWRSTVEEVDPGGTERNSKRSKSGGEELEHQLQLLSSFSFPFFF